MSSDTKQKEEWTIGLQFFLSARLRTQPFAAANRAHPRVSTPSMVASTQYMLDGIVWSLNDHPAWGLDAWPHVQNHLRDAAERFDELVKQLDTALSAKQTRKDPRHHLRATLASSNSGPNDRIEREQLYNAHAAVQDVYLAFCVVDAILKGCTPSAAASAATGHATGGALKEVVERELPHLVSDYFPIFRAFADEHAHLRSAVEEFRLLFLALLQSWTVARTLAPHTVRRLEEHLRHKLKTTRDGAEAVEAAGDPQPEADRDAAPPRLVETAAPRAVQQSLEAILRGTQRGGPPSSRLKAPRSAEMAERNIKSFLGSIFPSRRQVGVRICCPHCGAPFTNNKAKDEHYRYHFFNHNVMRGEDKVVRMSYPSQDDFIVHSGDSDQSGYFPKATELLEEAYKNAEKGVLKVRRLDDATQRKSVLY